MRWIVFWSDVCNIACGPFIADRAFKVGGDKANVLSLFQCMNLCFNFIDFCMLVSVVVVLARSYSCIVAIACV